MLVYGDIEKIETVGAKQAAVESFLSEAFSMPPGIERHGTLVTAFISASELVQGIVDAEFHERGFDALTRGHEAGMECLSILACAVAESWRSSFGQLSPLPDTFFEKLHGFDPSQAIRTKKAEGYAFYALYPESYLEAARASGPGPDTQVIGIRSIGTGLSALVAAELGAPAPITLRPVGHPFGRELRVDPNLTKSLASSGKAFAIVDEGPGLSGSSFGAVADWLEEAGISRDRIHFFPSHGGALGPQASASHRARWSSAARHVVTMDDLLLRGQPSHRIEHWVESLLGPLDGPLEEISGGAWRSRRYPDESSWPPANIQQERRKFLARANGTAWLVKFAGLGETGAQKLRIARQLHEAGFMPEPAGCCHGFLVERWHEGLTGLDQAGVSRESLVDQVGAYLGFRARHLPAAEHQGASLDALRQMAIYNTGQALGDAAAATLERSLAEPSALAGKVHRRICTDNRLHAWEWLVSGDRLIKTDALDHSAAHDLVGHQDVSWDVAGAIVELDLMEDEAAQLCQIVGQESGRPVDQALLAFLLPSYVAFQLGAHLMAAGALGEGLEAIRLRRAADRYGLRLHGYLNRLSGPEPLQEQEEVPAS